MNVNKGRAGFCSPNRSISYLLRCYGRCGDIEGVCIAPVTAQVIITFLAICSPSSAGHTSSAVGLHAARLARRSLRHPSGLYIVLLTRLATAQWRWSQPHQTPIRGTAAISRLLRNITHNLPHLPGRSLNRFKRAHKGPAHPQTIFMVLSRSST